MAKKSFKKPSFAGKVSKNVEKQRSEMSSFGYMQLPKGVDLFKESVTKENKGRIKVDIMPYPVTNEHHLDKDVENGIAIAGEYWYKLPFRVHRGIGGGDGETVVCPTTFGLKCPICEYRKKRAAEGADKDELKALNFSKRNLYAIIPIDSKEFDEKIHIWNTTDFFVQELINKELEEDETHAAFPDLDDGFTLSFRFDEESFAGHKYCKPSRLDFQERDAYDESILDEVPELDKILKVLSYVELQALLMEVDPEDIDDSEIEDEKDEKPARKRKTVVEDDDDEEEPAPPPARRKKEPVEEVAPTRTRRAKPEPDPVDDEDDDDEDAPEEIEIPEGYEICTACGGSGMNSKGRQCPICKGEGFVEIEDDDDDDEDAPAPPPARKTKPTEKATSGKCPHGHKWGADNDKKKECKSCDKWEACMDAE